DERQRFPEVQPLVTNPWTVLHAGAPARSSGPLALDLHDPENGKRKVDARARAEQQTAGRGRRVGEGQGPPAWDGTRPAKGDGDAWLVAAFADYERIVAMENTMRSRGDGKLSAEDRDRLGVALQAHRADYELGRRGSPEVPLVKTKADMRQSDWYRVASG